MKKSTSVSIAHPANGSRFNGENQFELKQLLNALTAFKRGNFSVRLPEDWTGLAGKVADTFKDVISINERMSREFERINTVVGKESGISTPPSLGANSEPRRDSNRALN